MSFTWLWVLLGILLYLTGLAFVILFFLYKSVFQNRVKRCLAVYQQPGYKNQFKPLPKEWLDHPLSNFYIASSHRSYLPCGEQWDLNSYDAIKGVINAGARFIHLDVYSDGRFVTDKNANLIVAAGKNPDNGRHLVEMPFLGKPLDFNKCLEIVAENAWLGNNYPFFLFLDLHLYKNLSMKNKVAQSVNKTLGSHLMNKKYAFQRFQLGDIKLGDTLNQVILLVSDYPNGPALDELTNCAISANNQKFNNIAVPYQNISYGGLTTSNQSYLTNFNTEYMTRVYLENYYNIVNLVSPKFDVFNMPYQKAFDLGCQFVCMNYQVDDEYMRNYIKFFQESGIQLKPANLLAKPSKTVQLEPVTTTNAPRQFNEPGWVTFDY